MRLSRFRFFARRSSTPNASGSRMPEPAARQRAQRGFTILEVALAGCVLAMGIATAITVLQYGLRAVDTARNMTLAGQIMQSEIEILRLKNWSQIVNMLPEETVDPSTTITSGASTPLDATLTAMATRFKCKRKVDGLSGRTDIKAITLIVTWSGIDGRSHEMVYQTRYAKNGLADYFYVTH